jgi:hypothetical protein
MTKISSDTMPHGPLIVPDLHRIEDMRVPFTVASITMCGRHLRLTMPKGFMFLIRLCKTACAYTMSAESHIGGDSRLIYYDKQPITGHELALFKPAPRLARYAGCFVYYPCPPLARGLGARTRPSPYHSTDLVDRSKSGVGAMDAVENSRCPGCADHASSGAL